jgi:hypothetical protein
VIRIYNYKGSHANLDVVKAAAKFFADKLYKQQHKLHVSFVDMKDNGVAWQDDNGTLRVQLPHTHSLLQTVVFLAHEMVHTKQFLHKELGGGDVYGIWKGKRYYYKDAAKAIAGSSKDQHHWEQYLSLPWEREAYQLQKSLTQAFLAMYVLDISDW